jgi:GrpB-like predicted nucleotidyltransferase (UPF0157 family)
VADASLQLTPAGTAWAERYRDWAPRIARALVDAFDGGVLLDLEHVGSTAVPGLPAMPTLDVMARVHPWPLPTERATALIALGFVDHGEHALPGRRTFTYGGPHGHQPGVGVEGGPWARQLALRDRLRVDPEVRDRYERAERTALASAVVDPGRDAWAAFQEARAALAATLEVEALDRRVRDRGFGPLAKVHGWLEGAPPRWAFAGGWALDAWAGAPARDHDDVDVAVDRRDALRVLDGLQAEGVDVAWVVAGAAGAATYRRRAVGELPPDGVHQAHARCDGLWVDVVLEPWTDGAWRYRRAPEIELPLARAVRRVPVAGFDLPVLAPAAVLLFKATTGGRAVPRPKDDADLRRVRAHLPPDDVAWLRAALDETAPGHPWCAPGGPLA